MTPTGCAHRRQQHLGKFSKPAGLDLEHDAGLPVAMRGQPRLQRSHVLGFDERQPDHIGVLGDERQILEVLSVRAGERSRCRAG